jgi:hypothetical protein
MSPPLLLVSIGSPPPSSALPPIAAHISADDFSDAAIIAAAKDHGVEAAVVCFSQDDASYLKAVHASVRLIRCGCAF